MVPWEEKKWSSNDIENVVNRVKEKKKGKGNLKIKRQASTENSERYKIKSKKVEKK